MNINNRVGLQNFGNTCFMNAAIQILMNTSQLGHYMINNSNLNTSNLRKYVQTFKDYMDQGTKILGPKIIYVKYMQLNTRYMGHTQEDSHEFLTYTLDDILENVKLLENDEYNMKIENLITINMCQYAHYKLGQDKDSNTKIKENMISFPIDSECKTLKDCYNLFMVEDNPDFSLSFKITSFPKYMFISLKRFQVHNMRLQKINIDIECPQETNLFHIDHKYKLIGFIIHTGGYMCGHYYAYCMKHVDNEMKWFCFNDTNVTLVDLVHVTKEVHHAYILLYEHI